MVGASAECATMLPSAAMIWIDANGESVANTAPSNSDGPSDRNAAPMSVTLAPQTSSMLVTNDPYNSASRIRVANVSDTHTATAETTADRVAMAHLLGENTRPVQTGLHRCAP